MFNKLNKSLKNKQMLLSITKRIGCLNSRSVSKTTIPSETDPSKGDSQQTNDKNIDYLGIFDVNNKEMSGLYEKSMETNDVFEKYADLVDSRQSKMNDQNFMTTTFGRVRLDSVNVPKTHGQYDPNNARLKFNIQEFEEKLENSRQNSGQNPDISQIENSSSNENNIFEDQYFSGLTDNESKPSDTSSLDSCASDPLQSSELGVIDRQYFSENPNIEPLFKSKINFRFSQNFNQFVKQNSQLESVKRSDRRSASNRSLDSEYNELLDKCDPNFPTKRFKFESPLKSELFSQSFDLNTESITKSTETYVEDIEKRIEDQKDIQLETEESSSDKYKKIPRTGGQYLEDLQSGKELPKHPKLFTQEVKDLRSSFNLNRDKLDSKGYRILSGQVFDYTKMTHEDIHQLLMDSILFNDVNILAINKPYGMSIHTKESNTTPVLTEYLPKLSQNVETDKLYTVHRLDKDTTGVLLLAKSQEKAKQLNRMFVEHSIIKRYLCITRGIPDQLEGIIDIPIEIGKTGDKERMVLRPEALEEFKRVMRSSKSAKRAVTQYKVVSQFNNSALIEVWPQTGVRHQIRVHLGFGLRCPILGDHKYSHLDRIAPQKLTGDMLLALNVRQAKVRHIPLHLHAMQYCLPNAGSEGRNIFINAPFPHHFQKNMSRLKLKR